MNLKDKIPPVFRVIAATIVYVALARAGLMLATIQQNASPVWPASGFAVALLLADRRRYWPAVFLGAWIANCLAFTPWSIAGLIGVGNTVEAVCAALVIGHFSKVQSEWRLILRMGGYVGGAVVGSTIAAVVGATSLYLGHLLQGTSVDEVALTWWVGDCLGILVFTPLIYTWNEPSVRKEASLFERTLFLGLLGLILYVLFFRQDVTRQVFLVFPFLLWSGLRMGHRHLRIVTALVAIASVIGGFLGLGPFWQGSLNDNLICLQLFLASVALTSICLAEIQHVGGRRLPMAVFLGSWIFAGWLYSHFENSLMERDKEHFKRVVQSAQDSLEARALTYHDLLLGAVGLMSTTEEVSRLHWRNYIQAIRLVDRYPAFVGMGVIWPVDTSNVSAFVERQRRSMPGFALKTVSPGADTKSDHFVITYVEPEERNRQALGLDVGSELHRRVAAENARDEGRAFVTQDIVLVQTGQKGFLFYLPFYHPGKPLSTVEERRRWHEGWVYAPFNVSNFFSDSMNLGTSEVNFIVYSDVDTETPIYERISEEPRPRELTTWLTFANRNFQIAWSRSPGFISAHDTTSSWVAACGALISILMGTLAAGLQSLGLRAEELAQRKTAQLGESESALRRTRDRLQSLISSSPVGIFTVNMNRQVTLWNPACERIFGWSESELIGQRLPFVVPGDDGYSRSNFDSVVKRQDAYSMIVERQRKAGDSVTVRMSLIPLRDEKGLMEGVMAAVVDISEERRAQQELESQRAMAVQNARLAALGEMAGNIAHEINNPLAIIAAQTSYLRMGIGDGKVLEQTKLDVALERIETVVFRISRIIKGLKAFSRNGEQEPKIEKDIGDLVSETLDFCQERFFNHGVRIQMTCASGVRLKCQSILVSQVLLNLLNNSFDAVVGQPNPWIAVEVTNHPDKVVIAVTDSGNGIPDDVVARMMEPFYTTKPIGKGTGLGLSIAKGIIEQHGGTLRYVKDSRNTRMVIELPHVQDEA